MSTQSTVPQMIMEPTNNWKQFLELCFLHGGLRTYIYWRTINSIIALISLLVSVECTTKISNQLDELQHCQLLKNVAMNLVWLFQDRAVATRPKMEQLTGFSRLVSAHGVSRPNGTSTLENRGQEEEDKDVRSIWFWKRYIYIGEQKMYRVFGIGSRPIQFPHAK